MAFWKCEGCGCGVEASSPYLVRAMGWKVDRREVGAVRSAVCPRCAGPRSARRTHDERLRAYLSGTALADTGI